MLTKRSRDMFRGYSGVNLSITGAAGVYGSTIKSYKITGAGFTENSASLEIPKINLSGVLTFVASVTDSRGRMVSEEIDVTVMPYSPPVLADPIVYRSNLAGIKKYFGHLYLRKIRHDLF